VDAAVAQGVGAVVGVGQVRTGGRLVVDGAVGARGRGPGLRPSPDKGLGDGSPSGTRREAHADLLTLADSAQGAEAGGEVAGDVARDAARVVGIGDELESRHELRCGDAVELSDEVARRYHGSQLGIGDRSDIEDGLAFDPLDVGLEAEGEPLAGLARVEVAVPVVEAVLEVPDRGAEQLGRRCRGEFPLERGQVLAPGAAEVLLGLFGERMSRADGRHELAEKLEPLFATGEAVFPRRFVLGDLRRARWREGTGRESEREQCRGESGQHGREMLLAMGRRVVGPSMVPPTVVREAPGLLSSFRLFQATWAISAHPERRGDQREPRSRGTRGFDSQT
jgi:hypothetical protein